MGGLKDCAHPAPQPAGHFEQQNTSSPDALGALDLHLLIQLVHIQVDVLPRQPELDEALRQRKKEGGGTRE
jgi:hypothetical protein